MSRKRDNMAVVAIIFIIAFLADIGSKPAVPARLAHESLQRLYAGVSRLRRQTYTPANGAVDDGNMATPVWSVSVSHASVTT